MFFFVFFETINLEMEIRVKTLADPDYAKLCRSGIRNNAVRCTVYSLYTVIPKSTPILRIFPRF